MHLFWWPTCHASASFNRFRLLTDDAAGGVKRRNPLGEFHLRHCQWKYKSVFQKLYGNETGFRKTTRKLKFSTTQTTDTDHNMTRKQS